MRRGAASANARWDNTVAILTGDFLFARASDILADLGPEAVRLQARTFERLVTGQIRETIGPGEGADPVDHYLAVLADKTASLIATSARFGAMLVRRRRAHRRHPGPVRRAVRRGVPALRRPARRAQRDLGLRQDARHRPAGRRADAARPAARAATPGRRTPGCSSCSTRGCPTTATTPRRSACCARTRWSARLRPRCSAGPMPPVRSWRRCRRCPPRPRSRRCATRSSAAPPEPLLSGSCLSQRRGRSPS